MGDTKSGHCSTAHGQRSFDAVQKREDISICLDDVFPLLHLFGFPIWTSLTVFLKLVADLGSGLSLEVLLNWKETVNLGQIVQSRKKKRLEFVKSFPDGSESSLDFSQIGIF
jgi:hypothetical protein